jgi:hypothetical protein
MYMPKLSLYKPERGNDYEFIDRQILEMFTVGGTDIHIHKYLGSNNLPEGEADAVQPQYDAVKETNIQDLLFLENRDRKYDPDVYTHRAIYNVQDIDFDLSQFGLFLSNDTLFMTVHIRSIVKTIGRKPLSGDVIELPHLKDEYALNDYDIALKRFYVIEDVSRGSEGFSHTWYPHLYRLKLKQIYDGQEYSEILDLPANEEEPGSNTLRDLLSTYEKEMQINNAVIAQAEVEAPLSGYETSHFYTIARNADGTADLQQIDNPNGGGDITTSGPPEKDGYSGYLVDYGDGESPNGSAFGSGISFPGSNDSGDYFLRTDYMPNRLFRFDGTRWIKVEDNLRETLTNSNTRSTLKAGFINNSANNTIGGDTIPERQAVSKALKPKADN